MANDSTNILMSTCDVTFGGTDLGHSQGEITVTYSPSYADISVNEFTAPPDKVLTEEVFSATVPMTETQVSNMKYAIPNANMKGSDKRAEIGEETGKKLKSNAMELVLHPIVNSATDLSRDVVLYKAAVTSEVEANYATDEQQIWEVTFTAMADDANRSSGNLLGHFGDSTA